VSVFTPISIDAARDYLRQYALGDLEALTPIAAGVENTNYFLDTTTGRYVLTVFETLQRPEIEFYMALKHHLAAGDIACPRPQPIMTAAHHGTVEATTLALEQQLAMAALGDDWDFVGELCGKPAAIVSRLAGEARLTPAPLDCERVGAMLARMHQRALDFTWRLENWRGREWRETFAREIAPKISAAENALIQTENAHQAEFACDALPVSVIHGDLFRDNVLWATDGDGRDMPGMIDFYFACDDAMIYDLAITANDFATTPKASLDLHRTGALIRGYHRVRPLTEAEVLAWPMMLRRAALRTWLGRLGYNHFPRAASHTVLKDHDYSQRLLTHHTEASELNASLIAEALRLGESPL
jgi:homoserine kinase type II